MTALGFVAEVASQTPVVRRVTSRGPREAAQGRGRFPFGMSAHRLVCEGCNLTGGAGAVWNETGA